MKEARLLVLVPFPREAAYTRYRVLQFVPDLAAAGIRTTVEPFLSSREFCGYYSRGGHAAKLLRLAAAVARRVLAAGRAVGYDAVLVGREALLFGPPWIETLLTRGLRRRLVYDFDDAVYLPNPNTAWGRWSGLAARLKCPGKTERILAASDAVLAGNALLAEYARRMSARVTIMPTVVNPDDYPDATRKPPAGCPVVGWVGTHTTAIYLESIGPALAEVARRRPFRLRLVGAGPGLQLPGIAVEELPWSLDREFSSFGDLDVALYPMPDTPWTRGKCGFKAIQYLAAGVPAICSPVGVTTEIVEDGLSGLFARDHGEWVAALDRLLDDASERRAMGLHGRETVRQQWSRQVHAPRFVDAIHRTLAREPAGADARQPQAEAVGR